MDRTDDMKQACLPPAEQDRWIRDAVSVYTNEKEAVGYVMRKSDGRCNPQYVVDEVRRLRVEVPAHLISYQDREESEVYCDAAVYPRTVKFDEVTCVACLQGAKWCAISTAESCETRLAQLNASLARGGAANPPDITTSTSEQP